MNNRAVVTSGSRGWRRRRFFLGLFRHLPFAQRRPAVIVGAAQDGGIANRYPVLLRFIDNALIERHGLRRGLIDARVMKAAFIQNGDRKDMRGNNAAGILSDFNHRGSPQLVRLTTLGERGVDGHRTYQHKQCAGQEPASAI